MDRFFWIGMLHKMGPIILVASILSILGRVYSGEMGRATLDAICTVLIYYKWKELDNELG